MEDDTIKATHIVMYWKSQNQEMLFRSSDGICIGQSKGETVIFGAEPNKRRSHVFIDHAHAREYLRTKIASDDLKECGIEGIVAIEDRDGEPLIQLPEGTMDIPISGSRRAIGGKFN